MIEIDQCLNELEDLVEGGSSVPWFGRRYVSEEQFHRIVNNIRHALPRSIAEAAEITTQRDEILATAREQAKEILDQAHSQAIQETERARTTADEMISRESVVREAGRRAEEMVRQADHEAASIRAETQVWLAGLFSRLENELGRIVEATTESKTALEAQLNRPPRPVTQSGEPTGEVEPVP